ncbi:cytochrome-c peroxidase [Hymenobacter terrenus]|uniref:cytochrome-c peroxidase n=1 Tax=Hymenobacter terrenus TaxID=1629124 RepID=UPI0006199FC6|nr:cytochrome c peroxidase [Hymenobacter terrenus]
MLSIKAFALLTGMAAGGLVALAACEPSALEVSPEESIGALPLTATDPADNPRTPQKVELGKALFYDPVLSGTRQVACATCHHPKFGYADGLELPIGVGGEGQGSGRRFRAGANPVFTKRNAPTLLNVAFNGMDAHGSYLPTAAPMFFDLRAQSLEEQALLPITTFEEMRGPDIAPAAVVDSVLTRLRAIPAYQTAFRSAFGPADAISAVNLGKALAAYERTLLANNSPFDRYRRGDAAALSEAQKRGLVLFLQNGCNKCHKGPMFSDYETHVLGVGTNTKLAEADNGYRGTHAFRTPSLRNLTLTAPYMHNGQHPTLEDVMVFYDRIRDGERLDVNVPVGELDPLLQPRVTRSSDLIEFLRALTDDSFDKTVPAQVPSGLSVGGQLY